MPVEGETRTVGNGIGTYKMIDGKLVFRITSMNANKGKDNDNMKKLRDARNQKNTLPKMSPRSAKIAFSKFYKSEFYNGDNKNEITKSDIEIKKILNGKKIYKKRKGSPKYAKGSEEAKKLMKGLREAKARKREEMKKIDLENDIAES